MIKEIKYIEDHQRVKVKINNPNEHIQKHWNAGSFYEVSGGGMLNYIYKFEKGGKYIDIGASIGNHTMFFKSIMDASEVHSIEPFRPSFDHLNDNVKLNKYKDVFTYNFALGASNGRCSMNRVHEDQIGMTQVIEGNDVELKTVDSCDFFEGYDVIKIDVEHYNEQLLKGAKETFTKGTGAIFIEAESQETLMVTDNYMESFGYARHMGVILNKTPTYLYLK